MSVLVTGSAGFIGFHVCKALLEKGEEVVGVDNMNPYYDPSLKAARNSRLKKYDNYRFYFLDLADTGAAPRIFRENRVEKICHLAAQAGVRYSIANPHVYVSSNITAFLNLLETAKNREVRHFLYASSSSVYGASAKAPFSADDGADHPVSLYAATKKSNELMAHVYANLYKIPCTGLRFFTVYGPWGRPDMAYFSFTKNILAGAPIDVYNHGQLKRDFTYVDDIAEAVVRLLDRPPVPDAGWDAENPRPSASFAPYRVFNIGNNRPVELMRFIETLEKCLGRKAKLNFLPMQKGDVLATCADVEPLAGEVGFRPKTELGKGLEKFVEWYWSYYGRQGRPARKKEPIHAS